MNENDIERICIPRDIKNLKMISKSIVIKNNDKEFNKHGVDIYIINPNTYEIKSLIDLKPSIEYDYRRQYYFELEMIYPNGSRVNSWGKHEPIAGNHFIVFTDQHRITFFNKRLVYKVLKEFEEKFPGEIKSKNDTDFNKYKCVKTFCLIGFNKNYEYLLKMKPIIFDISTNEQEGVRMNNSDIKELDNAIRGMYISIKKDDEEKFMKHFSDIMENDKISPLEKFKCTILNDDIKKFLSKHIE